MSNAQTVIDAAIKNRNLLFKLAHKYTAGLPDSANWAKVVVNDATEKASRTWNPEGGFSAKRFLAMQVFQHAMKVKNSKHMVNRASAEPASVESDWMPGDVVPRGFPDPERVLLARERCRLVNQALDALASSAITTGDGEVKVCKASRRAAVVFELVKFDGFTTKQAGEILGVSQPTAHRALALAIDAITRHVEAQTA